MGLMLAARVVKKSLRKSRASCGERGVQIQRPGAGGGQRAPLRLRPHVAYSPDPH